MRLFRPRRKCRVGNFADAAEAFLPDNIHYRPERYSHSLCLRNRNKRQTRPVRRQSSNGRISKETDRWFLRPTFLNSPSPKKLLAARFFKQSLLLFPTPVAGRVLIPQPTLQNGDDIIDMFLLQWNAFSNRMPLFQATTTTSCSGVLSHKNGMSSHRRLFSVVLRSF